MTFEDPILAGEVLIRDSIQSEGFVAGSTGWKISRNGNAEFNDATMRGELLVGDLNTNGLLISAGGGAPSIDWYAGGNYQQTTSYNVGEDSVQTVTNGGGITTFQRNNEFVFRRDFSGTGVLFDRTTGYFMYFSDDSTYVEEGWENLTLNNGWTNFGGPNEANGQYMIGPDGFVHLRGALAPGTTANGTTFATLPVGVRPTKIHRYICAEYGSGVALRHVRVSPDGTLAVWNAAGGGTGIMLDNIIFPISGIDSLA